MVINPSRATGIQEVPVNIVLPFYLYAAASYLISCVLLFFSAESLWGHHFQPEILAVTHSMALGWGTMMILGASYQLIPVLIESRLKSHLLARMSFVFAGMGIPFIVYGFHAFQLGWVAQVGGVAINLAVIFYVANLFWSLSGSKTENIHAIYILTASCWLLVTTLWGLLLLFNFTMDIFREDSLYYLTSHAHAGIVGWFLLLVLGVGSRLIPMFLISKYTQESLLWWVYGLVNMALILFIITEIRVDIEWLNYVSMGLIGSGLLLFIFYCWKCHRHRIRKKIDQQMTISLAAVGMMTLPLLILVVGWGSMGDHAGLVTAYGFCVFFGWLTAIILGMTFKTLPFIVWNKVYRYQSAKRRTPDPKDLFNHFGFMVMLLLYGVGFFGVLGGLWIKNLTILQFSVGCLIFSAGFYVWNVFKIAFHKAKTT